MPVLPPGGKTLVALVVWPPWCLTSVNSSCGFFCLARGAKDTPNTTSPPAFFCCLFVGFNEKTTENHPGFFGGLSSVCFLFQIIFMYPFFSWADTERTQEKGPKCTAWKFQPLLVFSIHLRPLKTAILVALKTNGRLCFAGSFSLNMFFVSLLNLSILFLDEWISSKFGLNNCWVMTAVYVFWYIYISSHTNLCTYQRQTSKYRVHLQPNFTAFWGDGNSRDPHGTHGTRGTHSILPYVYRCVMCPQNFRVGPFPHNCQRLGLISLDIQTPTEKLSWTPKIYLKHLRRYFYL